MNTQLKKRIMRRIYTAYAMRLLGGTRARHFMVMVLCALGFMRYVSILDVAHNFAEVSVGQAGQFVLTAVTQTESWTLLIGAVFMYAVYAFWRGDVAGIRTFRLAA